jgi:hypothetical protein
MASTDPIVLEQITHYREGEVIVITPQAGSSPAASIPLKDPAVVGQFVQLLKKLKASEEIVEPITIGDKAYMLAPSLTVDVISGPVFWEEIVQITSRA